MPNPFVVKIKAQQSTNPFTRKAKITISKTTEETKPNPFVRAPTNNKPNPFAARVSTTQADKLAEIDRMIEATEQRYSDSLTKAMKSGINRKQIKKLFDISDRHQSTLLNLCGQRRRVTGNGWKPSGPGPKLLR